MDLSNAIQQHVGWKIKLRNAIQKKEKLDAISLSCDDRCELGKWLHGPGKTTHGKHPSFGDCVSKHAAFHNEAGKVATTINQQHYDEAEKMLGGTSAFGKASSAVSIAITRLKLDSET